MASWAFKRVCVCIKEALGPQLERSACRGLERACRRCRPAWQVGLVDRPWNTALAFLPDAARLGGEGGAGGLGHVVLAGTGYHKLRLYDTRAGKRPQAELAFGEARITALAPEPDGAAGGLANANSTLCFLALLCLALREWRLRFGAQAGRARAAV